MIVNHSFVSSLCSSSLYSFQVFFSNHGLPLPASQFCIFYSIAIIHLSTYPLSKTNFYFHLCPDSFLFQVAHLPIFYSNTFTFELFSFPLYKFLHFYFTTSPFAPTKFFHTASSLFTAALGSSFHFSLFVLSFYPYRVLHFSCTVNHCLFHLFLNFLNMTISSHFTIS